MKATKFIVLICGAVGVAAFFFPLVHVKEMGNDAKASAWQFIKGIEKVKEVVKEGDSTIQASDLKDDAKGEIKVHAEGVKEGANVATGIIIGVFVPAGLLLLMGAFGAMGTFGRGKAAFTFIFGLLGVGVWVLLKMASDQISKDSGAADVLGTAHTMLAVSYFGGTLGGLIALIKPEQKPAA